MQTRLALAVAVLSAAAFAKTTAAVPPTLTVNGVTGTNSTIVPLAPFEPLSIVVDGPAGAPFAILVSLGADTTIDDGWFLRPLVIDTVFSPVHPVFDGIGTAAITNDLGLPAGDLVANVPAPFFNLGTGGSFALHGQVPPVAVLLDTDSATAPGLPFGPGTPIVLPLSAEIPLYMQVVALDPADGALMVGNGVTLSFGPPRHPAIVTYAEATDGAAATLTERLTVGTLVSTDLGGGGSPTFEGAPDFAAAAGALDLWMIQLAGPSELVDASAPPGFDPDAVLAALQNEPSDLEFLTGTRPARDSENREFPRIRLPGGRQLLHWRNAAVSPPAYGFACVDEATGAVTDLVPPTFGDFRGTATRSPWEVEVAVSPDGDRALVVLDESATTHDRAFLLRLDPGGTFPNGAPIVEVTPLGGVGFGTAFESAATFVRDDRGGSWIAVPASADPAAGAGAYPDRVFLTPADGTAPLTSVFPTASTPAITRVDRTMLASADRRVVCFIAGTSESDENVYALRDLAPNGAHLLVDLTGFVDRRLEESTDVTDGSLRVAALSADGSRYAGVRQSNGVSIPFAVRADGTQAGVVNDLVKDQASGGDFDLDHFTFSTGLFLTDDGGHLLFHQGIGKSIVSDSCDQFAVDLASGSIENLTRTISGPGYDGNPIGKLTGPWAPANAASRPTVGYGGSFLGPDGGWRFFFRDFRNFTPADRLDLYAVSLAGGGPDGAPTFELANVTGIEFEPAPGVAPPTVGAPSIKTNVAFGEQLPDFYRVRRFGGDGVLRNFYALTARLAAAAPGEQNIESLFVFDGENPGAALRLTAYSQTTSPIAVGPNTTIRSVTPNPIDGRIAFVLDLDGMAATADQELVQIDLASFGATSLVPAAPLTYDRAIAAGSLTWLPTTPAGLVWVEGTSPRPAGSTDGISVGASVDAPPDATPWFVDLSDPGVAWPLRPPTAAARTAYPLAVR